MLIQNIAIFCEIKLFHLSKKKFYVSFNIYISPYLSIYLQIYSRLLVNSVVKKKTRRRRETRVSWKQEKYFGRRKLRTVFTE